MPRCGPRRITIIGVGTPPPLTLRPLAMEVLRIWEAKQAPERQTKWGSRRRIEPAIGTGPSKSALTVWS